MPIVVALAVLVALIYGAVWSFNALHAHFGLAVAVGVAVVATAAIAAGVAYWLARRREVAANIPRSAGGDWTHELKRDWGGLRLAAGKRLLEVRVGEATGSYIFADLRGAREEQGNAVVLTVADSKHPEWRLPISDPADARKWTRILTLATRQKL
ncbi:hypothetical protein [Caballeronia sp. LZ001]|uniref:hypothetical protein n=1 Tax=Caballeronia sp. LZ001 TaxID=3038553 RepID=UPI00285F0063|nr:hypothetical protein [Caballeronia sp. LZ001]MDR5804513.1 hypothetical protein [Caballeronia sp. LZ001]